MSDSADPLSAGGEKGFTRTSPATGPRGDPYEATIALYKSRCEDLERELVEMQATITMEKLQHEALQAKLDVFKGFYRQVDSDLGAWYRLHEGNKAPDTEAPPSYLALVLRCAELQLQLRNSGGSCACGRLKAQNASGEEQLGKPNGDETKARFQMSVTNDFGKLREGLIGLLGEACRQVARARDVGARLRLKYEDQNTNK